MSDQPPVQTPSVNPTYPPQRPPYQANGYQAYQQHSSGASYSQGNQNGLNNMQTLKSSLPSQGSLDSGNDNRQTYNNPGLVVYTPAMSTYYNQQNAEQMPYLAANMMPTYYGNNGMGSSYAWPYISPAVTMDGPRRPSWSSNENITLAQNGVQDYYPPMSYMPLTTGQSQHYIAGPIQPMKCADNKSYEMVNLDELVSRDPPIPRAVPALWTNQEELSLAKCLQNPEGITNVYIRGFMPDTTDTDLDQWASRFGEIESCKAIIEQDTGKCKGFGFVMYYSPAAAENCIRGFFHLGFQASYAQKSRNSRLKDLEDKASTNIYCTGVPIEWNESDLANHFRPFDAISTKICRDVPSGVSKEVGFARFESREVAERVIREFHSYLVEHDGVKLCLRFADTKAQKQLKQQSQERRNWRSREYSYSVEHTPSPTLTRLQNGGHQISPHGSYQSPAGASNNFTPATSVSPPENGTDKNVQASRASAWPLQGGLQSITNTSTVRTQPAAGPAYTQVAIKHTTVETTAESEEPTVNTKTPSPNKVTIKVEPASGKENLSGTN